ncbi:MAG TPA: substrate-binding domain-containing protein [Candidatus Baltobacteraceae bacterium]
MRKVLATLALATVPAIALSACNGPSNGASGVSALPNTTVGHAKLRPNDFSSNDLHAGGATFPAYGYNLGSEPAGLATKPQAPPGTGSIFASIKLGANATIYYCLTGSGTGRGIFETGSKGQSDGSTATTTGACGPLGATPSGFGARVDPPDFAGTDVAMASTEYPTYKTTREPSTGTNWGEPFEFPVIGGPIIYAYRPQDFKKFGAPLHLSRWTYCAMANGTVSNWNDAAITADNGGKSVTNGASRPVTFYFRSDGSGTGFNFTSHLTLACNAAFKKPYNAAPYESSGHSAKWSYGVSQNWPGPGSLAVPNSHFVGESGNPGVLAAVQSSPYSTGYLEGAWAKSANPAVAQAWLGNGKKSGGKFVFVDPTVAANTNASFANVSAASIQRGMGSDGIPLGSSRPDCQLYLDPAVWNGPIVRGKAGRDAYPIMAASYLLFYGNNNNFHIVSKKKIIAFMAGGKAAKIWANLEYTPLSKAILTAAKDAALKDPGDGKGPCVK